MPIYLRLCLVPVLLLGAVARGAEPPPPPPPSESSEGELRGGTGSNDLSSVPIPLADRQELRPELTAAERAAGVVMVAVAPLGYTPPPIIYIDKSGMPRERYRNPLEYTPAVYHIATSKTTIRVMAGQNRIGPFVTVPRRSELLLSYQVPADPSSTEPVTGDSKPRRRKIGSLHVSAQTTHLLAILWKPPSEKLWTKPLLKVIDVSPRNSANADAFMVNLTASNLALRLGSDPHRCTKGFVGRIPLGTAAPGRPLPTVVSVERNGEQEELSQTYLRPHPAQGVFLLAWQGPPSRTRPSGVEFVSIQKALPPLKPFPTPDQLGDR